MFVLILLLTWQLHSPFYPVFPAQELDLGIYDWLVSTQKSVSKDSRIVFVAFTEKDSKKFGTPPSDEVVAQVLERVRHERPFLLSLTTRRELPSSTGRLQQVLANPNSELWTEIRPLPEVIGKTSDLFALDVDNVQRRMYLYLPTTKFASSKAIRIPYPEVRSLAWELAYQYLTHNGVEITEPSRVNQPIKLKYQDGTVRVINPLLGWNHVRSKFEQKGGFQVLLNRPKQSKQFHFVSFDQVLSGDVGSIFKNKFVFVCPVGDCRDIYSTPYNYRQPSSELSLFVIALSNLLNLKQQGFTQPIGGFWASLWLILWVSFSGYGIYLATAQLKNNNGKFLLTAGVTTLGILIALFTLVYLAFPQVWIPSSLTIFGVVLNAVLCVIFVQQQQLIIEEKLRNQRLNDELDRIKEKLKSQERLAFLGGLVPAVNHEIFNLLEAFFRRLFLMQSIFESEVADEKNFNYLEKDAYVLEEIVKNIEQILHRVFPRYIQDNKMIDTEQQIKEINLPEFLEECYEQSIYRFRIDLPSEFRLNLIKNFQPIIIRGNIGDLRYVFVNLIENAYQALLQKYDLDPQSFYPSLQIGCYSEFDGIYVFVQDNGIGVKSGQDEEIFKPFVTTRETGTGLGLSIARDIVVVRYNGTIQLNRVDGETRFLVHFPLANI